MTNIPNHLRECHDDVCGISTLLEELPEDREAAYALLRERLRRLRDYEFVSDSPGAESLCHAIGSFIDDMAEFGWDFSQSERGVVLGKCDELRLHVLTSGLLITRARLEKEYDSEERLSEAFRLELLSANSAITLNSGGVIHTQLMKSVVMVLPTAHSYEDVHDILEAIAEIYDQTPAGCDWVLDFSSVRQLPPILLATLISYRTQMLEQNQSDLHLCWVPDSLTKDPVTEGIVKYFDLIEKGGQWFSKKSIS